MPKRVSLSLFAIVGLLGWLAILLYTYYVSPSHPLAFLLLFLFLAVALIGVLTPTAYFIALALLSLRNFRPGIHQSFRQATLLTLVILINLLLRALNSWTLFMALVLFCIAVVLEILSLGRKS